MSERGYFSLRYALPGYTFLLFIFLINIKNLILSNTDINIITLVGILFGFITILSGSALGFIISQFWYLVNNYYLKEPKRLKKREPYKELLNKIDDIDEKHDLYTIMTYLLTSKTDKRILDYINRRRDLINSLASTGFAILLSEIVGYLIKIFILKIPEIIMFEWLVYHILIIFISQILLIIIYINFEKVREEQDSMVKLIISLKSKEFKKDIKLARKYKKINNFNS